MAKKLKTNKSIAKRVKVTKTGKIIHCKCWSNHLLTNKWKAPKRDKYGRQLSKRESKKVLALIPYSVN